MRDFGYHSSDDQGLGALSWFFLGLVFIGLVAAVVALL